MAELKSCGFLVVRGEPVDSFLLMIHPDRYDLPKGHVDPGESEQVCALRELEEETGITRQDISIDPNFRFTLRYPVRYRGWKQQRMKTLVIFLAHLQQEVDIQPSEHSSFKWFRWNPPHQIQTETIDPLLENLARHLEAKT